MRAETLPPPTTNTALLPKQRAPAVQAEDCGRGRALVDGGRWGLLPWMEIPAVMVGGPTCWKGRSLEA